MHTFAYLKKYYNSETVFDLSKPSINEELLKKENCMMTEYGDIRESIPLNPP